MCTFTATTTIACSHELDFNLHFLHPLFVHGLPLFFLLHMLFDEGHFALSCNYQHALELCYTGFIAGAAATTVYGAVSVASAAALHIRLTYRYLLLQAYFNTIRSFQERHYANNGECCFSHRRDVRTWATGTRRPPMRWHNNTGAGFWPHLSGGLMCSHLSSRLALSSSAAKSSASA